MGKEECDLDKAFAQEHWGYLISVIKKKDEVMYNL